MPSFRKQIQRCHIVCTLIDREIENIIHEYIIFVKAVAASYFTLGWLWAHSLDTTVDLQVDLSNRCARA